MDVKFYVDVKSPIVYGTHPSFIVELESNTELIKLTDIVCKNIGWTPKNNGHYDHSGVYLRKLLRNGDLLSMESNWIHCQSSADYTVDCGSGHMYVGFGGNPCSCHQMSYENSECVICTRKVVTGCGLIRNKTCGHKLFCGECADVYRSNITECPLCRSICHKLTLICDEVNYCPCYKCNKFVRQLDCGTCIKLQEMYPFNQVMGGI